MIAAHIKVPSSTWCVSGGVCQRRGARHFSTYRFLRPKRAAKAENSHILSGCGKKATICGEKYVIASFIIVL
ncbi:MAG: hypothetical protein LKE33_10175 [Acidaminococcus sp.]|jgi:hypothetical protein|nr:hypothetical protein [Acidaminococcus sp.]MCI2117072.1 hypothetical protein [Acidaminococcus sp.]